MKKLSLLILSLLLSACVSGGPEQFDKTRKSTPEGIIYETFYVEGMPCMRFGRGDGGNRVWEYDGVSCDWSKWDGNDK